MTDIYLSIGSNIHRHKHILAGINALKQRYSSVECSPIYESIAVGFHGDNFYNLVAKFSTKETVSTLTTYLTEIEDNNGRNRNGIKFGPRTLDLDLLLYGDMIISSKNLTLPRPEIYENAFVLRPLTDIAGGLTDPNSKQTFQQLWSNYDQNKQQLWPIEFSLN